MKNPIKAYRFARMTLFVLGLLFGLSFTMLHNLQARPAHAGGGGGDDDSGDGGDDSGGGGPPGGGPPGGGPPGGGGGGNTLGSADGEVTYYHLNSLNLSKSYDVIGPVVMVVDRDIDLGNQTIDIVGNGSLQLYFGGNISVGGKPGSGFNNSDVPAKMQLYGTHPKTADDEEPEYTVSLNGNGAFTGVLYAPEVSYRKNGGGGKGFSQGSVVTKDVTFNGSPGPFHYDEALKNFSGPFESSSNTFSLANYELLKAGNFAPSAAAQTVIGNVDYDALFDSLFGAP